MEKNAESSRTPQTSDKFILRLPEGMRSKIADIAKANSRSMNAEIVARLQNSFTPNLIEMAWPDLFEMLQKEAAQRGATITITLGK